MIFVTWLAVCESIVTSIRSALPASAAVSFSDGLKFLFLTSL